MRESPLRGPRVSSAPSQPLATLGLSSPTPRLRGPLRGLGGEYAAMRDGGRVRRQLSRAVPARSAFSGSRATYAIPPTNAQAAHSRFGFGTTPAGKKDPPRPPGGGIPPDEAAVTSKPAASLIGNVRRVGFRLRGRARALPSGSWGVEYHTKTDPDQLV